MRIIQARELEKGMTLLVGKDRMAVPLLFVMKIGNTVFVQGEDWAGRYGAFTHVLIEEAQNGSSLEAKVHEVIQT
jgi:hypothetical protein